jgi:hypothetical protein
MDERYPCSSDDKSTEEALRAAFGSLPDLRANDGVVPTRSQVWGTIIWAGVADHLDVLGHFPAPPSETNPGLVSRWLMRFGRGAPERVRDKPAQSSIDEPGSPAWEAKRREELAAEGVVEVAARSGGTAPPPAADARHVDWLTSGAGFDGAAFEALMKAVAGGMLDAAATRGQ